MDKQTLTRLFTDVFIGQVPIVNIDNGTLFYIHDKLCDVVRNEYTDGFYLESEEADLPKKTALSLLLGDLRFCVAVRLYTTSDIPMLFDIVLR